MAVVESVKAASDVYAPIAGTVLEVNAGLADEPEKINGDPYGDGWIVRMQPDDDDLGDTMDPDEYQELLDGLES
jgi:glycine cleavage system H protein